MQFEYSGKHLGNRVIKSMFQVITETQNIPNTSGMIAKVLKQYDVVLTSNTSLNLKCVQNLEKVIRKKN